VRSTCIFEYVAFATGLEDLGSLFYEQGVTLQEFNNLINEKALQRMYDFYKKFRAFHLDRSKLPRDTEARAVLVDRVRTCINHDLSLLKRNTSLGPFAVFCAKLKGVHLVCVKQAPKSNKIFTEAMFFFKKAAVLLQNIQNLNDVPGLIPELFGFA